jgi:hypothetical protein
MARAGDVILIHASNRRPAVLMLACLAFAISWTAPAGATPLPSGASDLATEQSLTRASAEGLGVSLWGIAHAESTDRDQTSVAVVASAPVETTSPCWVAGRSDESQLDSDLTHGTSVDLTAGSRCQDPRVLLGGSTRTVRHSSGNPRSTRTETDGQSASHPAKEIGSSVSWHYLVRMSAGDGVSVFLHPLFRPPKA